jgi:hypothetical protein
MSADRCPDCGAVVAGGRAGCQSVWDEIAARAYTDLAYAATHDLAFDAYCMQHPGTYCVSAKSYAAHLTRLCCGVEHGGDRQVYAAINRWLNGRVALEKPEVLGERGSLTVASLKSARDAGEHRQCVQAWANDVWQAYSSQHDLARGWVRFALSAHAARGIA